MQQHCTGGIKGAGGAPRHRQRGFTMIEVLIVLTIIGIALMYGLPSMSSWLQSNQIRNATESLQSGLQLAKSEAVRRNANVQFSLPSLGGTGAPDWVVACATPAADCPGDGMTPAEIQKYSALEGAPAARVAATQGTITFNGTGRVTPPAAITLNVTNPTGGSCAASAGPMRCLRVVVSPGGQIKMCDPALPSTNARGC